jgi:hypothetical protein
VINVDKKRCDALALIAGRDEPLHIPLPNFSREKAQAYREDLDRQLHLKALRMRGDSEAPERGSDPVIMLACNVRNILRNVWIEVVKPILDNLAYSVSALRFDHLRL